MEQVHHPELLITELDLIQIIRLPGALLMQYEIISVALAGHLFLAIAPIHFGFTEENSKSIKSVDNIFFLSECRNILYPCLTPDIPPGAEIGESVPGRKAIAGIAMGFPLHDFENKRFLVTSGFELE